MALTYETWQQAVDGERRAQTRSLFGVLARAQPNGDGQHTLTYHPGCLRRGEDSGGRVRIDDDLENATIRHYAPRGREPEWSGGIDTVLPDTGELLAHVVGGRQPRAGDAFLIFPQNYLLQLSEWLRANPQPKDLSAALAARCRRPAASWKPIAPAPSLRRRQRAALALAGQPVALLWGPPGTGKTHTLAHLAAGLVQAGKRVMVIAPTRVAADTAALAIDSAIEQLGLARSQGQVLRTDLPELYTQFEARGDRLLTWMKAAKRFREVAATYYGQRRLLLSQRQRATPDNHSQIDSAIAALKQAHAEARDAYKQEQANMIEQAQVVCSTLRQNQARLWHTGFDQLLVDESSMVSVSDAMQILVTSPTPTIFAGDHKQLGPIAESAGRGREESSTSSEVAAEWLGTSILELLDQRRNELGVQRVLLDEQSRMNAELCAIVSDSMYEGELRAVDAPRSGIPPWLPSGVCVLDSDRPPPWLPPAPDLGRPLNLRTATLPSAAASVALARHLAQQGHSVVLAAPFRSQAALLRRGVDDLGALVRAGTVHRLQGQEADVAVYDPTKPHQYWPDQSREAPLMLNVAASRAKRAFVLCNGMTWLNKSKLLRPFLKVASLMK